MGKQDLSGSEGIFKAYDVRGIYPIEINEAVVFEIASALGKFWKGGLVIIGHDARLSSKKLYVSAQRGLRVNKKLKIFSVGMMTTPMLSFLVSYFRASGGMMITASHNPKMYNGIKAVGKNAAALSGKDMLKILKKFK